MRKIERFILLDAFDSKWKDHLHEMDALKSGIGLRGYAQEDPKVEYKREGYSLFEEMLRTIQEQVTDYVLRIEIARARRTPSCAAGTSSDGGREIKEAAPGIGEGRDAMDAAAQPQPVAGEAEAVQAQRPEGRPQRPLPLRQRAEVQEVPRGRGQPGGRRNRSVVDLLYLLALDHARAVLLALAAVQEEDERRRSSRRLGRGLAPRAGDAPLVWIHAVSVGEVKRASRRSCARLRELRPDARILITTTTTSGLEVARQMFPEHEVRESPLDFVLLRPAVLRRLPARPCSCSSRRALAEPAPRRREAPRAGLRRERARLGPELRALPAADAGSGPGSSTRCTSSSCSRAKDVGQARAPRRRPGRPRRRPAATSSSTTPAVEDPAAAPARAPAGGGHPRGRRPSSSRAARIRARKMTSWRAFRDVRTAIPRPRCSFWRRATSSASRRSGRSSMG